MLGKLRGLFQRQAKATPGLQESIRKALNDGNWAQALPLLDALLLNCPDDLDARLNAGFAHMQLGQLDQAASQLKRVLAGRPRDTDAHYMSAVVAQQRGHNQAALASLELALAEQPAFLPALEAWCRTALDLQLDKQKIAQCLERAIATGSAAPDLFLLCGEVFDRLGVADASERAWQALLSRLPGDPRALLRLGELAAARQDWSEAYRRFEPLVLLQPEQAVHWHSLGVAATHAKLTERAIAALQRAIKLSPDEASYRVHLAMALHQGARVHDALLELARALELNPALPEVHEAQGLYAYEIGRIDDARQAYERAMKLAPDRVETFGRSLFLMAIDAQADPHAYVQRAKEFGQLLSRQSGSEMKLTAEPGHALANPCLAIGMVSGDLNAHPVGRFLRAVLAQLDRKGHRWIAFNNTPDADELTLQLRAEFDDWFEVRGLSDRALAERIRQSGVDILLDLSGHTAHNRLPVFALRPARLQFSWLGYFASTGVEQMDGVLADALCVPPGEEWQFAEPVVRLPGLRYCFSRPPDRAELAVRPAPVLKRGYWTFGCFQRAAKLNRQTLAAWRAVLDASPGARLRLQSPQVSEPLARRELEGSLAAYGIPLERVELVPAQAWLSYLEAYHEVDFVLDSFPFTGGTTTCEALWMGVPTLTWSGHSMLTRQGESLMRTVGLDDWVCSDAEAFVLRAKSICADAPQFDRLRQSLRARAEQSPVFDSARFAKEFVSALDGLWDRSQSRGQQPAAIRS